MPDYRWGIFLTRQRRRRTRSSAATKLGAPRLERRPRRAPQRTASHHRHAGRHRAGQRRAAAPARPHGARASTTSATCSRSTSKRAVTCGRWCTCCTSTSAATGATRPTSCSSAAAATRTSPGSWARSTSPATTGCRSSRSRCSPTATASISSPRCPRAGFDPLARTTQFMLTEEAHHLFVGETGLGRIIERTAQLREAGPQRGRSGPGRHRLRHHPADHQLLVHLQPRPVRRRDLEQRRRTSSPRASRAASASRSTRTTRRSTANYRLPVVEGGKLVEKDIPLRNAMNEVLARQLRRRLRARPQAVEQAPRRRRVSPTRLTLPSRRFHRHQGIYADHQFDPAGNLISRTSTRPTQASGCCARRTTTTCCRS